MRSTGSVDQIHSEQPDPGKIFSWWMFDIHHYWLLIDNFCNPQESSIFINFCYPWTCTIIGHESLIFIAFKTLSLETRRPFLGLCHHWSQIVNLWTPLESFTFITIGCELLNFKIFLTDTNVIISWPKLLLAIFLSTWPLIVNCQSLLFLKIFDLRYCWPFFNLH